MTKEQERSESIEFWLAGPPTAEQLAAASNTCRRLAFMLEQMAGDVALELKATEQADILRASSVFLADWIRITAAVVKQNQS